MQGSRGDDQDGAFSDPFFFDDDPPVPAMFTTPTSGGLFVVGDPGRRPRRTPAETATALHVKFRASGSTAYVKGEGPDPLRSPEVAAELDKHIVGDRMYQAVIAGFLYGYRGAQLSW